MLSTIIFLAILLPYMILFLLPIVGMYFYLQKYYSNTTRELRRLDSIAKSPVFAAFQETLDGITTSPSLLFIYLLLFFQWIRIGYSEGLFQTREFHSSLWTWTHGYQCAAVLAECNYQSLDRYASEYSLFLILIHIFRATVGVFGYLYIMCMCLGGSIFEKPYRCRIGGARSHNGE